MQVFFGPKDQRSEAVLLIEALNQWLAEIPDAPVQPATANFKYGADGSLRTINIVLDEEE